MTMQQEVKKGKARLKRKGVKGLRIIGSGVFRRCYALSRHLVAKTSTDSEHQREELELSRRFPKSVAWVYGIVNGILIQERASKLLCDTVEPDDDYSSPIIDGLEIETAMRDLHDENVGYIPRKGWRIIDAGMGSRRRR